MSTAVPPGPSAYGAGAKSADPYAIGHRNRPAQGDGSGGHGDASGHGKGGPGSKRIVVAYGFWIFLLSDIIMFSAFFAAYAVLGSSTAGGPTGAELFDQRRVAIETMLLLLSSFTAGMSSVAADRRRMVATLGWLVVTGLLGLGFLVLEVQEFAELIERGAGPQRSAFLSSFFALVGCHGLHVACGLLWLGTMIAQFWARGFQPNIYRRFLCFNLFWHALDIIWVGVFTIVYLMGAGG
jgi:cytochrome o ubiquinol oxidase subunit 3